jgi:hypothetical protein
MALTDTPPGSRNSQDKYEESNLSDELPNKAAISLLLYNTPY